MRLKTLAAFLVGDRDAILRVAADRAAVPIGALFVLSAGFAREYDAVDLRREPWRLALPFVASLVMSALLFVAVRFGLTPRSLRDADYSRSFGAFLGCFWMTAPLAWLYAIPYERFLSPGDAARANLATLGLVALWRVVLITRVCSVLSRRRFMAALFPVMLAADGAMLLALRFSPIPPLQVMGGVQLTDREMVIQHTAYMVGFLAVITFLIWLIGSVIVIFPIRPSPGGPEEGVMKPPGSQPLLVPEIAGIGVWFLAIVSVVIWVVLAPGPQRQQRRAAAVDDLLNAGKVRDAVALMSSSPRSDFPPVWEPAPRVGYGEIKPSPLDVLEIAVEERAPAWVTSDYLGKVERSDLAWRFYADPDGMNNQKWERLMRVVGALPDGKLFLKDNADLIDRLQKLDRGIEEGESATQPTTVP